MRSPLDVTVVIPTYNRAELVIRALESVRTQRMPPAHIIVVDDVSTDGTPDAVQRWAAKHGVPVTVDVLARNGGAAIARNRGIELATTQYVAFLDSDDEHLPDTLQRLILPLDFLPDAVLSFADAAVVTPSSREPRGLFTPRIRLEGESTPLQVPGIDAHQLSDAIGTLLKASIIPTSATCFRRNAAMAAGLMPANFRSGEDWLFWLRLAQQGRFVFQLDDLALHHRHDANLTHASAAAFVSLEKLRGFIAIKNGTVGVTLTAEQQVRITAMLGEQFFNWRYSLSLLGSGAYFKGLNSSDAKETGSLLRHLLADPRGIFRSLMYSVTRLSADT